MSSRQDLHACLGATINWVVLGQGTQAAKECHSDTLRTLKRANAKIKETSPQALMS